MHAFQRLVLFAFALRSSIVDEQPGGAASLPSVADGAGDAAATQSTASTAVDVHPSHQWLDAIEEEVSSWFVHLTKASRIRELVAKARAHLPGRDAE
ncbi:hypothetical protein [Paraburkholderia nemoris]|uniref:hypothetical protein n=1 Tax=Paraburkholderia nemoris TaxID=2793076 RepID=UPI001B8B0DDD|nr:hypothetical protein [Paraburkholderia nemoris]